LLLLERGDRLCEKLVEVSSWFKRVAAASDPGQNTLKYKGYGLSKPSLDATVSDWAGTPLFFDGGVIETFGMGRSVV
jgi:hypothetical protein